jgi:hypothetical protein
MNKNRLEIKLFQVGNAMVLNNVIKRFYAKPERVKNGIS